MTSPIGERTVRTGMKREDGFTLLELLLVVTLLGCLFGIAIPQFRGTFESARLEMAAESIARCAYLARSQATASGQVQELFWDPATSTVGVRSPKEASVSFEAWTESDDSSLSHSIPVPSEYFVRWSATVVRFYPDATSENAWVELENSRGTRMRIEIDEYRTSVKKGARF